MSNLTALAFPFEPTIDPGRLFHSGLTKHEYAAILLAGHLATTYKELPTIQEGREIAVTAHFLATQVLEQFR